MLKKETADKLFVEKLTNPKSKSFLNQTSAYKEVHPNANGCAQPNASRLMNKPNIQEMFLENMKKHGLHDENVNKRHAHVLENGDDGNTLRAVRMYHELKGRYDQHKDKHGHVAQVVININARNTQPIETIDVPITDANISQVVYKDDDDTEAHDNAT